MKETGCKKYVIKTIMKESNKGGGLKYWKQSPMQLYLKVHQGCRRPSYPGRIAF